MNSNQRVLTLFALLYSGKKSTTQQLAEHFKVSTRTIERDLKDIKDTLSDQALPFTLEKDLNGNFFTFANQIDQKEILAVSKILLASRAFDQTTMDQVIDHLLAKLAPAKAKEVKKHLGNEQLLYQPPRHEIDLLPLVEKFNHYIQDQTVIQFDYQKNRGQIVTRTALPVSLYFSEYYFYAICYNPTYKNYLNYRLDRFLAIQPTSEKIKIEHKDRLEAGELRKKLHFMYSGTEIPFTFRFRGIVEAALDRLPEAKVIKKHKDGSVIISATAQDTGVIMWLLSQGKNVEVLTPKDLVAKMREEVEEMNRYYN